MSGLDFGGAFGVDPATASEDGMVYVANGSGGGGFIRAQGWGHYQDAAVTAVAGQSLSNGVRTQMTNDGVRRTREHLPSDAIASLWNISTDLVMPVADFDMLNLRLWFTAANFSGGSPDLFLEFDLGGVDGVIWSEHIPLASSSPMDLNVAFPAYAGPDLVANGGKFFMTYTGSSTCDIHTKNILVIRDSKNYVEDV